METGNHLNQVKAMQKGEWHDYGNYIIQTSRNTNKRPGTLNVPGYSSKIYEHERNYSQVLLCFRRWADGGWGLPVKVPRRGGSRRYTRMKGLVIDFVEKSGPV